ncbi:MAG: FtsX-like permease family protein, partial [Rhodothermales bacterium]
TLEMRLNDRFQAFTVIGVLEELPKNSTLTFDMLLPFDQRYEIRDEDYRTQWGSYGVIGFIQLVPNADTAAVSKQLLSIVEKHYGDTIREDGEEIEDYAFLIAPFSNHHLGGGGTQGYAVKTGVSPAYVYLLSIIAVLVLLIACFNFMNLSVGQAASRLKEVGVRKVVGAARKQLLFQFGFEALVLSVIAALVGVMFVAGALPSFNYLTEAALVFQPLQQPIILGAIILITLITVLFAGLYPAFILSGIKSIAAFRGRFRFGGANRFTQSLVVLQFACTIIFLIGTVFISKQHSFMQEAALGFEKEQVVIIPINAPEEEIDAGERLLARFQESLAGHPTIHQIAGTSNAFTQGNSAMMRTLENGKQEILFTYRIDDQFIETLGMELIDGRNFNAAMPSDAQSGIIINEAFAKVFEMEKPVGQIVPVELGDMTQPMIIGVVKDFHFQSLHTQIKPAFFHQRPPFKMNYLMAKISPAQVQASIAALRETWTEFQPEYPFEYQFLDEVIDEQYKAEERWSLAMSYASWIAIFIACLGLLGLTSITMTRRTKEIGIRKVLGASIPGLVNLLSKEFVILVAIANLIAWPVAYLAISRWLEDFSYQIEIGAGVFIGAGIVTLGIALLTISYQSIRTASSDPVKSLKYE